MIKNVNSKLVCGVANPTGVATLVICLLIFNSISFFMSQKMEASTPIMLRKKEVHTRPKGTFTVINERRSREECFLLLISKFEEEPNTNLAIEIIKSCLSVLEEYKQKFDTIDKIRNSTNIELHLWKNIVYSVIEILRKSSCTDSPSAVHYKTMLLKFIDEALKFYFYIIDTYESLMNSNKFTNFLFWPENVTSFSMDMPFIVNAFYETRESNSELKLILRSAQRHFLAIGDLFRYKSTLIDSSSNAKAAKRWYFKAMQFNFYNGRAFNQLGVLSSQARNYLDMMFYYVLALAAKYSFNSARESLGIVCNQVYQIPALANVLNDVREKPVRKPLKCRADSGRSRRRDAGASSAYEEVWIRPDKNKSESNIKSKENAFDELQASSLSDASTQRTALLKWLHLSGILLTNIGMDEFQTLKNRSLNELFELISAKNSVLSSITLLKLALIFVFTFEHVKPGASQSSTNLQREYAAQAILDILGVCVSVALRSLDKENLASEEALVRVLPTIVALTEWFFAPSSACINVLAQNEFQSRISTLFNDLVQFLNKIRQLTGCGRVEKLRLRSNTNTEKGSEEFAIVLPESVLMSAFYNIFPALPTQYLMSNSVASTDLKHIILHSRLGALVLSARRACVKDAVAISPSHLIGFGEEKDSDGKTIFVHRFVHTISTDERKISDKLVLTPKKKLSFSNEDDEILKKCLIGDRNTFVSRKLIVEILPKYLVPDTNTFIDHLDLIKRIVNVKCYIILVPTTVIAELSSLSTDVAGRRASGIVPQKLLAMLSPELGPKSRTRNVQMQYVMEQANATLDYFKQASQDWTSHLATITTNGNVLSRISFAQEILSEESLLKTNDDRILASCVELSNKEGGISQFADEESDEPMVLRRNIVFLTEDRALCIKAVAAKIPTRSAPQFLKWSGISFAFASKIYVCDADD